MAKPCQCCSHRSRKAIDRALLRGDAFTVVGRRYGIHKDAVGRHHHAHVLNAIAFAASQQRKHDMRRGGSLLEELDLICADCERLMTLAEGKEDIRAALLALNGKLKGLELRARLTGAIDSQKNNVTVNLNVPQSQLLEVAETFIQRHRLPEPAAPILEGEHGLQS
jgi:hypothetical protein